MTNWKTSAVGILLIVGGFILVYMGKITWTEFLAFLGAGGVGIFAKDSDVTGGTRMQ